jgi:hypothetical protein
MEVAEPPPKPLSLGIIDHVMHDIVTSEEAIKGSPNLPLPRTKDITRKKESKDR